MQTYPIPLVPGPVSVPQAVREAYLTDYGSPDLEGDFFDLYAACERQLQQILATQNDVTIHSGEGMLALWAALKSVLRPGDRVLAVANGLFGYGIGEMAAQLGAVVETVGCAYDDIPDPERVRAVARRFQPKLITAVHCETPSGTLTPLAELGAICREVDALFYVDFVASGGGVPVLVDECSIDLGLLGSQKVLSLLPTLSMVTVSPRAWDAVTAIPGISIETTPDTQHPTFIRHAPMDNQSPNTPTHRIPQRSLDGTGSVRQIHCQDGGQQSQRHRRRDGGPIVVKKESGMMG